MLDVSICVGWVIHIVFLELDTMRLRKRGCAPLLLAMSRVVVGHD